MFTRQELLEMIATEAHESIARSGPYESLTRLEETPTLKYDLRLVRDEQGILEWRDDNLPLSRSETYSPPQAEHYESQCAQDHR